MPNYTEKLNLYLTDMESDGEDAFDFDRDLNENFEKIDTAIGNIAINLNPPGCINSGTNSFGESNVLIFNGQIITLASSTILTLFDRTEITLSSTLAHTNIFSTAGTYHLFYNNGALISVANFYVQQTQPSPSGTAVWFDNSVRPAIAKYYNGSTWSIINPAYVGSYIVASSTVSSVIQPNFNQNFLDYIPSSDYVAGTIAANGSLTAKAERTTSAALSGATSIYFPKNAPKGINIQCRLKLTTSVASPTLTFYNSTGIALIVANWVYASAPVLSSITATYDILLESSDGGVTIQGRYTQIGS